MCSIRPPPTGTSALAGITLVLVAVFVPMAFFPGSVGVIYRQFAITLVTAMALSVVVAVVLTPVLCASLLRPATHAAGSLHERMQRRYSGVLGGMLVGIGAPLLLLFVTGLHGLVGGGVEERARRGLLHRLRGAEPREQCD
mgnify:CR=1 FL=1